MTRASILVWLSLATLASGCSVISDIDDYTFDDEVVDAGDAGLEDAGSSDGATPDGGP